MKLNILFKYTISHRLSLLLIIIITSLTTTGALFSCTRNIKTAKSRHEMRDTMYQVSTLQALLSGDYDGHIKVEELRKYGDIGMGTFDRIDGEMIILDGTVYQARHDGSVSVADDKTTIPFANITHFESDFTAELPKASNMDELTEQLTKAISTHGLNSIYVVRIDITHCDSIHVRSELPQEKPYRPLMEVMQTAQREFQYKNIGGTIVAQYFPTFFDKQNSTGWHCHFISNDKTKGGHMFNISTNQKLTAHFDVTPYFTLYLTSDTN